MSFDIFLAISVNNIELIYHFSGFQTTRRPMSVDTSIPNQCNTSKRILALVASYLVHVPFCSKSLLELLR